MKLKLLVLSCLIFAGCASNNKGEIPTIASQTFNTKVPGERIKIDKSCGWIQRDKCTIESIQAVGVAPSIGATRLLQEDATNRACMKAKANVVRYVFGENINDFSNTRTRNKQNENQKDRVKSKTEIGQDVDMASDDADKDTNYSIREALINSDIETIRTITQSSQGRLVGFKIDETKKIDDKTMSCVIVWNKNDSQDLKKIRSLISGS
tara:strand:- start:183 stop:809 length:627 start_codon:yes stop_codon:yes gene_type:complete